MAYIYLSGGWVLRVNDVSRQGAVDQLSATGKDALLTLRVATSSGAAVRDMEVSINPENVSAITDEPLPQP